MTDDILSKTLVTGSDGMAGSYVDFGIRTNRRSFDVTDLAEVLAVCRKYKPRVIFHLAAETDVDRCERDPEYAYLVNGIGTYHMTVAAREIGAKLVYISTAGVFDGVQESAYAETDVPNPQNYYGHSKYAGELAVRGNLSDYLILRVCWMVGGGPAKDQKFVAKIIKQIREGASEIRAVTDQIGAPTFGKDLVAAAKILIQENKKGIFHLPNAGVASRYDVAKFIAETLAPQVKVFPVDSSYFKLDAKRTRNEVIASSLQLMRPWQEALKEYLATEWK